MTLTRRRFLAAAPAAPLAAFRALAEPQRGRAKISDIRAMVLQGPRTYTLVKALSDTGVYGIGEAFGSPAAGIKDAVLELRSYFLGKDPLEIETLFSGLASADVRAAAGIEIALWDLAGKLLNVPVHTLLGGRKRDRIRVYTDEGPPKILDKNSCFEWGDRMKKDPAGWTAFKFGPPRSNPKVDVAHDPSNRVLTSRELREIRQSFEYARDAIGWDFDLIVACEADYDVRTLLQLAEAVEPVKPLWLEPMLPLQATDSWLRLRSGSKAPVATGSAEGRRGLYRNLISAGGCDIIQPDVRNAGGLLEAKKIADLGELYYLATAAHNSGSAVATLATVHWAAAVKDFLAAEMPIGRRNWMDDVVVHEGPIVTGGHVAVPDKPGLGIELNRDVVKANLANGEKYWD